MKCSGEATGCSRCIKQTLFCHYSIQKQMGRPRKKRMRAEDDDIPMPSVGEAGEYVCPDPASQTTGLDAAATVDAFRIFPPFYCATMAKMPHAFPHLQSVGDGRLDNNNNTDHNNAWQSEQPSGLFPIPATASPWPDFSMVSASSSCLSSSIPLPGLPETQPKCANPTGDSAECSCLSCLYLCLSHLSTLSYFPVTQQTICSLYIAARTVRGIIRCEICTKSFASGMQNVMLTGTLLNVVADAWLRVSEADAAELGKQAALPQYVASINSTLDPAESWKQWLRQVVRRAVIGGPVDPSAGFQCSSTPDLLSLIKEMEARQRRWHSGPGSHPWDRSQDQSLNGPTGGHDHHNGHSPLAENQDCDERDLLCLRVVGSARRVISRFKFELHEYPDGVVS